MRRRQDFHKQASRKIVFADFFDTGESAKIRQSHFLIKPNGCRSEMEATLGMK